MVAPISVFPDVGGAFFGSYRGARQARLQEAAMRAEMAAAQADRQRQAQARESFARLQGPDQVVGHELTAEQTGLTSQLFGMPRLGVQERVVREGLTPEQRAREEQRYAQADPDGFMAYRQSQARPGVDIPEGAVQNIGSAVARGDITWEGGLARLINAGVPEQEAPGRLGLYVVPPEQDQVSGTIVQTEQGQLLVNPITGERIAQYGRRPRSSNPAGEALAQYLNAQTPRGEAPGPNANAYPSGTVLTAGELYEDAGVDLPVGVDPQTSIQVESQPQGRGNFFRPLALGDGGSGGGSGAPGVGGDVLDDLASQVRRNITTMDEAVGNYVAMSREAGNTEVSPEYARLAISHRLSNEAMGFEQANTIARHSFEADSAVRRQLRALDEIYNVSAEYGNLASGLGANLAFIRGTPAAQLKSYLENVTSQEIVDQLREMREYAQSIGERGSGFGQLTQNEIRIMEAMQTLLSQDMPPERLRREAEAFARELHFARSERMRAMELFMPEVYSEFSAIQRRSDSFRSPDSQDDGEDYSNWEPF